MRRLIAGATLVLAASLAPDARADCGAAEGLEHVLPVDGSRDVDRSARVVVRYTLADAPIDDAPSLDVRDDGGDLVGGTSVWDGREIVFTPDAPLAPRATFSAEASRPDRDPFVFSFQTAAGEPRPAPPVLGTDLEARARYLGDAGDEPCGPDGLERYGITLTLPAARGSSGPTNLVYLAFETRGHGVEIPTERARFVDEAGDDPVELTLFLPADGVEGTACFRVVAQDVTGLASGTTDEACARLEEGPFFRSLCTVGTAPAPRAPSLLRAWPAIALALLARRAAKRRARGRLVR